MTRQKLRSSPVFQSDYDALKVEHAHYWTLSRRQFTEIASLKAEVEQLTCRLHFLEADDDFWQCTPMGRQIEQQLNQWQEQASKLAEALDAAGEKWMGPSSSQPIWEALAEFAKFKEGMK